MGLAVWIGIISPIVSSMTSLVGLFTALASPIGQAGLLLAGIATAGAFAYAKWKPFHDLINTIWEKIVGKSLAPRALPKGAIPPVKRALPLGEVFLLEFFNLKSTRQAIKGFFDDVAGLWNDFYKTFKGPLDFLMSDFKDMLERTPRETALLIQGFRYDWYLFVQVFHASLEEWRKWSIEIQSWFDTIKNVYETIAGYLDRIANPKGPQTLQQTTPPAATGGFAAKIPYTPGGVNITHYGYEKPNTPFWDPDSARGEVHSFPIGD